jgi:predicted HAD superfamily Cof-like phosphohydrolase
MREQTDVAIFMEACGQHVINNNPAFTTDNIQQATLYMNLVREEFEELHEGFENKDVVEIADACGDLIWVILGLANSLGIPMRAVWQEVASSNMSKTVEGKVIKREDGKILKPDTYFPPNIHRALGLTTNE